MTRFALSFLQFNGARPATISAEMGIVYLLWVIFAISSARACVLMDQWTKTNSANEAVRRGNGKAMRSAQADSIRFSKR
jgi:hypothetical protein